MSQCMLKYMLLKSSKSLILHASSARWSGKNTDKQWSQKKKAKAACVTLMRRHMIKLYLCLKNFMSMDTQQKQLTWVFMSTFLFFKGCAWSRTCLPSIYFSFTGAMYVYNLFTSFEDLNPPHQPPPHEPIWLLMPWLELAKKWNLTSYYIPF